MASPDAVSPAPAPAPAAAQQTVVLRVSIHCLGCKKKVRKVLRSIEGVQEVKVDGAMHKVTVTGTVDGDTIVRRLYKSGKQAVPWQHPHVAPVPASAPAAKAPEPAPQPVAAAPTGDGGKGDATPEKAEVKAVEETPQAESSERKIEQSAESEKKPEAEKEAEKKEEEAKPSDEAKKDGGESEAAPETKAKGGDGAEPTKEAVPAAAKKASNDEDGAKEEKSKPKDAGDAAVPAAAPTTTDRSLKFPPPAQKHAYEEQHYPYPYPYYGAPQPVVSYHTAQPTTSVSYYAPRPEPAAYSMQQYPPPRPKPAYSVEQHHPPPSPQPQPMQQQWSPSYLYMPYPHSSPDSYYRDYYSPPGTMHAPPPPPLQDEYRMFDDENPNACSVM